MRRGLLLLLMLGAIGAPVDAQWQHEAIEGDALDDRIGASVTIIPKVFTLDELSRTLHSVIAPPPSLRVH